MTHELRRRIVVTVCAVIAARLLVHLPIPFVDPTPQPLMTQGHGTIGWLGLGPYVSAAAFLTLLHAIRQRGTAAPGPRELHIGLLALGIALVEGFAMAISLETLGAGTGMPLLRAGTGMPLLRAEPGALFRITTAVSLAAGSFAMVGLARAISVEGIGNGLSIFIGIQVLSTAVYDLMVPVSGPPAPATPALALFTALIAVAWIALAALVLGGRWHAMRLVRKRSGEPTTRVTLHVAWIGVGGMFVAEYLLSLGMQASVFTPPAPTAWILVIFDPSGLVHAALFVGLSLVVTSLFTACAYDARGFEATLVRQLGRPTHEATWLDGTAYEAALERMNLLAALGLPLLVVLSVTVAGVWGVATISPLILFVLTAVTLDVQRQWRIHRRLASAFRDSAKTVSERCWVCGAGWGEAEAFCPACGAALKEGEPCDEHPAEACDSRCVVCRRKLCELCRSEANGRIVCRAHRAITLVEGWASVSEAGTVLEAQILKDRLETRGIEAVVLTNTTAPTYGTHGIFEVNRNIPLIMNPECAGGSIRVLVRPDSWPIAREILAASPALRADA